jgi:hypothetical protein
VCVTHKCVGACVRRGESWLLHRRYSLANRRSRITGYGIRRFPGGIADAAARRRTLTPRHGQSSNFRWRILSTFTSLVSHSYCALSRRAPCRVCVPASGELRSSRRLVSRPWSRRSPLSPLSVLAVAALSARCRRESSRSECRPLSSGEATSEHAWSHISRRAARSTARPHYPQATQDSM